MNQVKVLMQVYFVARRRRLHAPLVSLGHRSRPKDRNLFHRVPWRNLERVDVAKARGILRFAVDHGDKGEGAAVKHPSSILRAGLFFMSSRPASRRRLTKINDPFQLGTSSRPGAPPTTASPRPLPDAGRIA